MKPSKKATSPLAQFMKKQLESKKSGNKFGVLGKDISKEFTSGEYIQPEAKTDTPKGKP